MEILKKDISELAEFIKGQYQIDFTNYALSSFKRRIERIIEVEGLDSIDALKEKMRGVSFRKIFVNEVTVNTTEFFRDPSMWAGLKEVVLPELAKKDQIRVLHAACSSGQEVYSFSITMKEEGIRDKARIKAVDLNPEMLVTAKEGKYASRILEQSEENYKNGGRAGSFSDYVTRDKFNMFLDKELVNDVNFQEFNLVTDQENGKFDIIFIRNVLIYFDQSLQNKVLEKLTNALEPGGFLIVGSKETIAWTSVASNFSTVSSKERIYQKL